MIRVSTDPRLVGWWETIYGDLKDAVEELHDLSRRVNIAWSRGEVSDDVAQVVLEAIHDRRKRQANASSKRLSPIASLLKVEGGAAEPLPTDSIHLRMRRYVSKVASIPGRIASLFTQGQQAALGVIAFQVRKFGACQLAVGVIARKARTSERTVQYALKIASAYGVINIRRRRRATHFITITLEAWRDWWRTSRSNLDKPFNQKDFLDPPKGAKNGGSEARERAPAKAKPPVMAVPVVPVPQPMPVQAPQESIEPVSPPVPESSSFDQHLSAVEAAVVPVRPEPEDDHNPMLSREVMTLCGSWRRDWGYFERLSPERYPGIYASARHGRQPGIKQGVRDWLRANFGSVEAGWSIKSVFPDEGPRCVLLCVRDPSNAVMFRMRWGGR